MFQYFFTGFSGLGKPITTHLAHTHPVAPSSPVNQKLFRPALGIVLGLNPNKVTPDAP